MLVRWNPRNMLSRSKGIPRSSCASCIWRRPCSAPWYAVDPAYRRRGYARAALEALLQRAVREPQVRTVRVTISPDNVASYQLASQYGFTEIGEQWDDEDGLEIIYAVDA
jgi:RimJ/RimL family protein N-acetyltransferase